MASKKWPQGAPGNPKVHVHIRLEKRWNMHRRNVWWTCLNQTFRSMWKMNQKYIKTQNQSQTASTLGKHGNMHRRNILCTCWNHNFSKYWKNTKMQQKHTNMLYLQPPCWKIVSLRNKRWNLHRCNVWWICSNHNVALGRPEDIQNVEACDNSTKKQENLKNNSVLGHPNRCSTFQKGSLSPSLPQTWNLNVPWDASKTAWDEKQNHQKTSGISIKFSQDARLGRSKGTPPGAKKTNWAILEGPRDPQGAQKQCVLSIIKYH